MFRAAVGVTLAAAWAWLYVRHCKKRLNDLQNLDETLLERVANQLYGVCAAQKESVHMPLYMFAMRVQVIMPDLTARVAVQACAAARLSLTSCDREPRVPLYAGTARKWPT